MVEQTKFFIHIVLSGKTVEHRHPKFDTLTYRW